MKNIRSAILIIISSVLLFELLAFVFLSSNSYFWPYRYLYISENNFRILDNNSWSYEPNANIKVAATFRLPGWSQPRIEYICEFKTNEFGYTKTAPAGTIKYDVLLMGDSFLEGHGGCSWINEKTMQGYSLSVFNSGAQSYGVAQMDLTRRTLEAHLNFKNAAFILITDDFLRPIRNNWIIGASKCLKGGQCGLNVGWYMTKDFSKKFLVQNTEARHKVRHKNQSLADVVLFHIKTGSKTFEIARLILEKLFPKPIPTAHGRKSGLAAIDENINALKRTLNSYPDTKIILIPQRDETRFGFHNATTREVLNRLKSEKIKFTWCRVGGADYMPFDGHLNEDGYRKVRECLFDRLLAQ